MQIVRPEKPRLRSQGSRAEEPVSIDFEPRTVARPVQPSSEPETQPEQEPSGRTSPPAPKSPQLLIAEPDYPTYQKDAGTNEGRDAMSLDGESEAKDRPAVPYYHPAAQLEGKSGRDWIVARFEVEANGTFKVEMLEGTGDIHQDARILNVLRRWKWLPLRIDGQTHRSVEVIRLFRHDLARK